MQLCWRGVSPLVQVPGNEITVPGRQDLPLGIHPVFGSAYLNCGATPLASDTPNDVT